MDMDMDKPVIRLFFAKLKNEFLDLPEEEKSAYMKTDRKNIDELGMEAVAMVNCGWSTDEWDYIGVEKWPSMDAVKKREQFEKHVLEIDKYVRSKVYLGTSESFADYGKE